MDFVLSRVLILDITIVGVLIIGGFVLSALRKPPADRGRKPAKAISFTTSLSPLQIMEAVRRFANAAGYQVARTPPSDRYIVLSERVTLFSWGFFYPIYVEARNSEITQVDVGIRSKLVQIGPVVTYHHQKCANGLRAVLWSAAEMMQGHNMG